MSGKQVTMPSLFQRVFYPEADGPYKIFMEYTRVIVVALTIALVFRTFIASPYKIPSSSMMPTLLVGDYLFVSKYSYGLPVPFSNGERLNEVSPQRGDIVVFKKHLPMGGMQNYIKRVVAVPGDIIAYKDKTIILNEEPLSSELLGGHKYTYNNETVDTDKYKETLNGTTYIKLLQDTLGQDVAPMRVPVGHFVVIGDNRDSSYDSRYWHYPSWGFVPMSDIVGRAEFLFWSWGKNMKPRFDRIGESLRPKQTLK